MEGEDWRRVKWVEARARAVKRGWRVKKGWWRQNSRSFRALISSSTNENHILRGGSSSIAIPQGQGRVALPFGICDAYIDLKDPSAVQWVEEANKVCGSFRVFRGFGYSAFPLIFSGLFFRPVTLLLIWKTLLSCNGSKRRRRYAEFFRVFSSFSSFFEFFWVFSEF